MSMVENHFERFKVTAETDRKVTDTCTLLFLFSTLVLTCYRLKKGRATFFRPKTIVASFLHLMVLSFKVIFQPYFKTPVCGAAFS